jgi:DNA polymerase-3 subunit epsilon
VATLVPSSTLLDRALALLAGGPRDAEALSREVLGLPFAPPAVAERLVAALLGADPRVSQQADGSWALVPGTREAPLLDQCAFAVVDIETTGMRASTDRVIEIGVVVVQGWRRHRLMECLVNPGRPLPPAITRITGLTMRDVAKAPSFAEVADRVRQALSGRVFVAHHAGFDWSFLSTELRRAGGMGLQGQRLCTARLARRLVPEAESCGLDWLSQWFGIENPARHRAGGDAWATAALLLRLLDLARCQGARTLDDVVRLQHRHRDARLG